MAKVYSITALLSMLFTGGLVFVMNLETLSHIGGLIGVLSALFFAFMAYRKKLLNTGFDAFRNQYRIEMNDFKKSVLSDVNMFREMMNENDKRHIQTLNRIVELYESTNKSVGSQAKTCELLQVKKVGEKKIEEDWKRRFKNELDQVQKDVIYIKKVLNHK